MWRDHRKATMERKISKVKTVKKFNDGLLQIWTQWQVSVELQSDMRRTEKLWYFHSIHKTTSSTPTNTSQLWTTHKRDIFYSKTNAMLSEHFTPLCTDRPTETPVSGRETVLRNSTVKLGLKLPDNLCYSCLGLLLTRPQKALKPINGILNFYKNKECL